MTQTIQIGTFGITCIVFFRRHADTNQPIWAEPQVWTYEAGAREIEQAKTDLAYLRSRDHLFVPADALTISTHGRLNEES